MCVVLLLCLYNAKLRRSSYWLLPSPLVQGLSKKTNQAPGQDIPNGKGITASGLRHGMVNNVAFILAFSLVVQSWWYLIVNFFTLHAFCLFLLLLTFLVFVAFNSISRLLKSH